MRISSFPFYHKILNDTLYLVIPFFNLRKSCIAVLGAVKVSHDQPMGRGRGNQMITVDHTGGSLEGAETEHAQ